MAERGKNKRTGKLEKTVRDVRHFVENINLSDVHTLKQTTRG